VPVEEERLFRQFRHPSIVLRQAVHLLLKNRSNFFQSKLSGLVLMVGVIREFILVADVFFTIGRGLVNGPDVLKQECFS
jgi:hypothetical protein